MHQSDTVIQSVVDSFARELLAADEAVRANLPDYGDVERDQVSVHWWRYRLDGCTHVVYLGSRRATASSSATTAAGA